VIAVKGFASLEAETVYTRARELCARVADCQQLLFSTLRGLWVFHQHRGRHDASHDQAGQMLVLAQRERSHSLAGC
jgi:predicted ATPase